MMKILQTKPAFFYCAFLLFIFASALSACSFSPERKFDQICSRCTPITLFPIGANIPIKAFSNNIAPQEGNSVDYLHVYLEGDGRPYAFAQTEAQNPNSKELTAFKLMTLDKRPAVYLARPCYGFDQMALECKPIYWTSGRYSQQVVNLLNESLDILKLRQNAKNLVLIGHSGGGSLAMLLAQKRQDISAVITIAANLDHKAWSKKMNFLKLEHSLNPAEGPLLDAQIKRWHLVGTKDQVVPAPLIHAAAKKDPLAETINFPVDHSCCWQKIWPEILERLETEVSN